MLELFGNWDPGFCVELVSGQVVPVIGGGFVLGAMFWLVGYVVDFLFSVLKGGFFWMR